MSTGEPTNQCFQTSVGGDLEEPQSGFAPCCRYHDMQHNLYSPGVDLIPLRQRRIALPGWHGTNETETGKSRGRKFKCGAVFDHDAAGTCVRPRGEDVRASEQG